jgi:hypothetical protein
MAKTAKRPRDTNQLAKLIADISVGDVDDNRTEKPVAVAGRMGGLKGGVARAKALPKKRRVEIAEKAAAARWKK